MARIFYDPEKQVETLETENEMLHTKNQDLEVRLDAAQQLTEERQLKLGENPTLKLNEHTNGKLTKETLENH
jgi:hypothetical protein